MEYINAETTKSRGHEQIMHTALEFVPQEVDLIKKIAMIGYECSTTSPGT